MVSKSLIYYLYCKCDSHFQRNLNSVWRRCHVITTVLSGFIWNLRRVEIGGLIHDFKIEILVFSQTEVSYDVLPTCSLQYAAFSFEIWVRLLVWAPLMISKMELPFEVILKFHMTLSLHVQYCTLPSHMKFAQNINRKFKLWFHKLEPPLFKSKWNFIWRCEHGFTTVHYSLMRNFRTMRNGSPIYDFTNENSIFNRI